MDRNQKTSLIDSSTDRLYHSGAKHRAQSPADKADLVNSEFINQKFCNSLRKEESLFGKPITASQSGKYSLMTSTAKKCSPVKPNRKTYVVNSFCDNKEKVLTSEKLQVARSKLKEAKQASSSKSRSRTPVQKVYIPPLDLSKSAHKANPPSNPPAEKPVSSKLAKPATAPKPAKPARINRTKTPSYADTEAADRKPQDPPVRTSEAKSPSKQKPLPKPAQIERSFSRKRTSPGTGPSAQTSFINLMNASESEEPKSKQLIKKKTMPAQSKSPSSSLKTPPKKQNTAVFGQVTITPPKAAFVPVQPAEPPNPGADAAPARSQQPEAGICPWFGVKSPKLVIAGSMASFYVPETKDFSGLGPLQLPPEVAPIVDELAAGKEDDPGLVLSLGELLPDQNEEEFPFDDDAGETPDPSPPTQSLPLQSAGGQQETHTVEEGHSGQGDLIDEGEDLILDDEPGVDGLVSDTVEPGEQPADKQADDSKSAAMREEGLAAETDGLLPEDDGELVFEEDEIDPNVHSAPKTPPAEDPDSSPLPHFEAAAGDELLIDEGEDMNLDDL